MVFFTSTTPRLLDIFFTPPLAYPTLHFLRQLPHPPDKILSTPFLHRFLLRLYAWIFSSLQIQCIRHTLGVLHFKSTPPTSPDDPTPFFGVAYTPLCTYLKNSYASDTPPVYFLPQLPLPSWSFFFTPPLAYPTLHCFASTSPILQIRFCLPPPLGFLRLYIHPGLFFFTNIRHTLLHFISTSPPPVLSSLSLSGIPSYSFAPAPPPPPQFYFCYIPDPRFFPTPLSSLVFCTPEN